MKQGFELLTFQNTFEDLLKYREQGAVRGVYLGFPLFHEFYTMSLPGCTDWTGFPQCFTKEQLIITENGCKEISKIKVGEKVLSYNHDLKINEFKTVVNTPSHVTKQKILKIKMKDGTVIKVTENHLFWDGKEYVKIKNLLQKIISGNFNEIPINKSCEASIINLDEIESWEEIENEMVYDLTVIGNHNFYLKTNSQNILVHNSGKSEFLLEMLLNTSLFYGWKHLLYVPDVGDMKEALSILIHKKTGKTFDKRYKNYITESEVLKELPWITHYFQIVTKKDLKAKLTPYEFWDYAAELNKKTQGGIQTATIDSWKDMQHNSAGFGRDDQYLEDVLSYRNAMSELHNMHFHTVIHPRTTNEKDAKGNRKAPGPDSLKGGSEWWNNGKCMITAHRVDGSVNEVDIMVLKAKPKSVAKIGTVQFFFDATLCRYYVMENGIKRYASEKYIKPSVLEIFDNENEEENDYLPF